MNLDDRKPDDYRNEKRIENNIGLRMYNKIDLKNKLESIHRKSYPAYKSLRGSYTFGDFVLSIDHVQGDPFAAPSSLHVELPLKKAGFPEKYFEKR